MSSRMDLCFKKFFSNWFALFIGSLMLSTASPLFAQEEIDEDEFTLEEIVVTAEKREAELQKVAMDISVMRPDEMARLNINQVEEIGKLLPDLNVSNMASSFLTVTIREVQQPLFNPTYETTVATHLDGIQLTRVNGLEGKFYDLERVEVLKGPQGTLYGRGSTAGSMNIVSKKPVLDEFGGNLELEYGNYDQKRIQGALNIPIMEKLAIRIAGRAIKRDGYVDAGFSNNDSWGGRLSLKWAPTDNQTLTITTDIDGSQNQGFMTTGHYMDTYGNLTIVENPNLTDPESISYDASVAPYASGGKIETPWDINWWFDEDDLEHSFNDNNSWGISAQYDYEMNWGYFTVQYGHREMRERKNWLFLLGPSLAVPSLNGVALNSGTQTEVWLTMNDPRTVWATDQGTSGNFDSIELRLTSKSTIAAGDKFEWIVGTMYMDDLVTEWAQLYENMYNKIRTKETALFGQASWSPLEKWNFTAGYRYAWDTKDYLGNNYGIGPVSEPFVSFWVVDPIELNPDDYYTTENKWNEPSYKFNISYTPTDSLMTYLQYARGYKTGNVNRDGIAIDPEFMDAYELGLKSRFFDNRVQVNLSAYYYLYENYNNWYSVYWCEQASETPGECMDLDFDGYEDYADSISVPLAPGGAEQKGINANIMWLLTANDTFTMSASYSKNEYDDYDIGAAMRALYPDCDSADLASYADRTGQEFGGSPLKVNLGYSHTWYVETDKLTLFGNLFYTGEGIDQIINQGEEDEYYMPGIDAHWLGDMSVNYVSSRWVPEGMEWHLRLWCNNIWDSDDLDSITYSNTSYVYSDNTYSQVVEYDEHSGIITGTYVQPRTYGITFGFNF